MSVVVVVVISASCAGYGVSSFFAKLFSLSNKFSLNYMIVFRHLNMDFGIILEYTFSQFQDKNINIVTQTLTRTALSAPYNNKILN